jgi:hypothetical protein
LPVHNWFLVREKQDFGYLLKRYKKLNIFQQIKLKDLYLSILQEFVDTFGQNKTHEKELDLKMKLIDARLLFVMTADRFLLNEIEILERQILELKSNDIDIKFDIKKEVALISKTSGFLINLQKTSVYQYYTQRKLLEDASFD